MTRSDFEIIVAGLSLILYWFDLKTSYKFEFIDYYPIVIDIPQHKKIIPYISKLYGISYTM